MPVNIVYNDPQFDPKNYPLTDWHRDTIALIASYFNIPDAAKWTYHATIHGGIFWPDSEPIKPTRLHLADLQFLANLPGLRWFGVEDGALTFALTHKQPAA